MDELESAKKRKIADMQKQRDSGAEEEKIKALLRRVLDDAAYDRIMNVRIVNPQLYMAAAQGCVSVFNRLGRTLGEKELLLILQRMKADEKETKIKFERK
ncbi:hypothetical protein KJ780_03925 [Candidatus Micrarchaeota archaeon]|nr:hypothetical protein [Candidatus Micrarchaeota archaeon]